MVTGWGISVVRVFAILIWLEPHGQLKRTLLPMVVSKAIFASHPFGLAGRGEGLFGRFMSQLQSKWEHRSTALEAQGNPQAKGTSGSGEKIPSGSEETLP